ncbi:TPA: thioredoxin [Candidatus Bathyarchaeota archaeon]|nr:thioredoxin [Candidatus Bathyarchaeota archaeon]
MDEELEKIKLRKLKELMERMGQPERGEAPFPSEPIKVVDETFDDFVRRYPIAVVDCWAAWCGPCLMLSPIIEQLAKEYRGKIVFGKLNVDENAQVPTRFGIMSIPTLLIFREGRLVDKVVGALPKGQLEARLRRLLGGGKGKQLNRT